MTRRDSRRRMIAAALVASSLFTVTACTSKESGSTQSASTGRQSGDRSSASPSALWCALWALPCSRAFCSRWSGRGVHMRGTISKL